MGGLRARLASGNPNKLRELARALPGWELELLDAGELPPEEGSTYYENARTKARFGLGKALAGSIAAVSVGVVDDVPLLDLDYSEDSRAEVDMNVVMTGDARLVEVQATAERTAFPRAALDQMLDLAEAGIARIRDAQQGALGA